MDLNTLLLLLRDRDNLRQLPLDKVLSFITRASVLKRDIMQPQPSSVSIDMAPIYLPPSVSQFLGDSLDMPPDCVHDCWAVFKDVIWDHPASNEAKRVETDAFRVHGKKCGLSESLISCAPAVASYTSIPPAERTIYPDQCCCINPVCARATKGLPLKKEQQRPAVIFTAADGAFPAWSIHLYCIGK